MHSSAMLLVILSTIFGLIQMGSCYQCYSCAGAPVDVPTIPNMPKEIKTVSKSCADPIKISDLHNSVIDCNDGISTCTKIEIKVADVEVVMRGCLPPQSCTVFKDCHTCSGNLCNSSSAILPSVLIISIISLLVAKVNF